MGEQLNLQLEKNSIFYKLGSYGLITFSDYIFLLTVLSSKMMQRRRLLYRVNVYVSCSFAPPLWDRISDVRFEWRRRCGLRGVRNGCHPGAPADQHGHSASGSCEYGKHFQGNCGLNGRCVLSLSLSPKSSVQWASIENAVLNDFCIVYSLSFGFNPFEYACPLNACLTVYIHTSPPLFDY